MTPKNLPEQTPENTEAAMRALAISRYLSTLLRNAETQAKAYLAAYELRPKDRRTVALDDGSDIGTISMVQGRRGAPKITDPVALAAWLDERSVHHGGTLTMQFPDWFTHRQNLEGLLERFAGEIPDGLEIGEDGAPYVTCRQTGEQAETLRNSLGSVSARDLLSEVAPTQIGGAAK